MSERPVLRTVREVRAWRAGRREAGEIVALVPTMGALHEGHLSLIDAARDRAGAVLVSVFVNPTQFGPSEDFERYPRDLERDVALAAERGASAVFAPSDEEMYPAPQTVWVEPGEAGERLCGRQRPGHFRGVLTVVAKLFSIVEPEVAVFGRKDFQQSVLVRRMVEELHLPVEIVVAPTVRDADGLALSSRNVYLSAVERRSARALSGGLRAMRLAFASGERDPVALEALARSALEEAGAA
ncbi:MAG: pantoate--beta-alanine ligase, partial [Gemmatimonadota bacterium]